MPLCQRCNAKFPWKVRIDNKIRILRRRRFCLECSPFGLHNTKDLNNLPNKNNVICQRCHKVYDYKKSTGHTLRLCNSCMTKRYKHRLKAWAVEYKGGKCVVCGYSKCIQALDFHHLDESQKEFGIGGNLSCSQERLKREVDKCILLCSNCHREYHEGMIKLEAFSRRSLVAKHTLGKGESTSSILVVGSDQ
jgi:hypothetical protein